MAGRRHKKAGHPWRERVRRWGRYIYLRLVRQNDEPEKVAKGVGLGVFIGIFPTFGVGTILAILIASWAKWNRASAVLGTFIMNPLLVSIWPLPHTIVAGTVMPTVLFSQASGIYNYSKIKFISWKVGVAIGLSTIAGGFLGPKLTELVTLDQYKFIFGWILIFLSALMLWQTTPGYLAKNKKEQAILKEFKKRAEDAAKTTDEPRRAA